MGDKRLNRQTFVLPRRVQNSHSVSDASLPDWEKLLAAERHIQLLVPGATLVGGTAAALHARHRRSLDGDHVLVDLRSRFDQVLQALESVAGWKTERIQKPVLILGQLNGILTGIRQLRRTEPLETEDIQGLRVPTLGEMARIKAWLLVTRRTVRDYLDTVVLLERLGIEGVKESFRRFDLIYSQLTGASVTTELVSSLAAGAPVDVHEVELPTFRGLVAPWNDWNYLLQRGRFWSAQLAQLSMEPASP